MLAQSVRKPNRNGEATCGRSHGQYKSDANRSPRANQKQQQGVRNSKIVFNAWHRYDGPQNAPPAAADGGGRN